MTPTALTSAGRGTSQKPPAAPKRQSPKPTATAATPAPRGAGHRAEVRRQSAPRAPRRVSGPLGGVVASGIPLVRPQVPAVRPKTRRAAPRVATEGISLGARWAAIVRGLPDHRLLDRIIRGRAWIPILGVLLAGIVAMQVEVLKLNASIGNSLERGTALQSRNELLRASVTSLSGAQRIESLAARMGMVMPAPAAINFLSTGSTGDIERAAANIHPPDATSFAALLALTDSAPASQAAPTTPVVPSTTSSSTGATDTTAASTTAAPTDTTASSTPAGAPAQPTSTDTTPAGTTAPPASTTPSAGPTETTPAVAPTQPGVGTTSPASSGGGVGLSSGGTTTSSTGT